MVMESNLLDLQKLDLYCIPLYSAEIQSVIIAITINMQYAQPKRPL